MNSSIPALRKSSGSIRRAGSRKSISSSKSRRSTDSASREAEILEEVEPVKPINYREELTFLFFNSMLEDIIEDRQIIPTQESEDNIAESIDEKSESKDIQEVELQKANMVPLEISKPHKSSIKSNLSKKSKASHKLSSASSLKLHKQNSANTFSGSKESCRTLEKSTESVEEGLEWVIKTEEQNERILFRNGNVYEGQTSKWLMHGEGTFNWADGASYTGYFADGLPNGHGNSIFQDLSKYEGDFCKSYFHGMGVLSITSTPTIYRGFWKNGKKDGKGWLLYEAINWYEGEWIEDERHGFGYRQYKNGAKYKGGWSKDKKNGEGSMIWENNDYYVGEWKEDQMHGYGEYTWNICFNKNFVFPCYNWYKGSWVEGKRHGTGIMNFGDKSGSKLACIWQNNFKHGPGIMICGNGYTLQRNPLFEDDKPIHVDAVAEEPDEIPGTGKRNTYIMSEKNTYLDSQNCVKPEETILTLKDSFRKIGKQIQSKIALETFDSDVLADITHSGLNIGKKQFVVQPVHQLQNNSQKVQNPLEIPIHIVAEEVDLTYYIDLVLQYFEKLEYQALLTIQRNLENESEMLPDNASFQNDDMDHEQLLETYCHCTKFNEARLIRNLLIVYLPKLVALYNQYATMAVNQKIDFEPVLIRLFLWQLLRDIGLPHQGVPLTEADIFLADNPSSCLETVHYPFEPLYFWQFLQSLVGCSWLLFLSSKKEKYENPVARNLFSTNGTLAIIFKDFLEENVFPNAGIFQGTCLTEYKDLLPLKCVYDLYLRLGEPHAVHDFLYFTCVKKNKDPPCYAAIPEEKEAKHITDGINIVPLADKIIYLEDRSDITYKVNNYSITEEESPDIYRHTLYTFRTLGRRKIIRCLAKICPKIYSTNRKVNIYYNLTFLEFYEAVILCAYEQVEKTRRAEELYQQEQDRTLLKSIQDAAAKDKGAAKKKKK